MARDYSPEIQEVVEEFFDEDGWSYQPIDERGVIMTGISLHGKMKNIQLLVSIQSDGIICFSSAPIGADESNKAEVAEFITRANYGLSYGNFEMDYRDGEVRYKTTLYCGDGEVPTLEQVRHTIIVNALMMKRYGDGLMEVLFDISSPEEAVRKCEQQEDDD